MSVYEIAAQLSDGNCCSISLLPIIMDIYHRTRSFCPNIDLQPLCQTDIHKYCYISANETTLLDDPGRSGSDVIKTGSDIMSFCNRTDGTGISVFGECHVTQAFDTCLAHLTGQTIENCRYRCDSIFMICFEI